MTKLTLSQLSFLLDRACTDLRGNRDASEYIFGMLFLKRLSDLFDQERVQLSKDSKAKGMADDIIAAQLGKQCSRGAYHYKSSIFKTHSERFQW